MLQEKNNHRFPAYPTHQAVQALGTTAFINLFVKALFPVNILDAD
jgi:hypothetical protein